MGEAKNRGTREQRVEQALQKKLSEDKKQTESRPTRPINSKLLTAALIGSIVNPRILR